MRVNGYTTATSVASDDYFLVDGATNGTRKLLASSKADIPTETTVTLSSSGWTEVTDGDNTYYTNTVSVTGVLADNPIDVHLAPSATTAQELAALEAIISKTTQAVGSLTVYAYGDNAPSVDLPMLVRFY